MYSPPHFLVNDRDTLAAFMCLHSFATIVSHDGQIPHATHMPVLHDPDQGPHGALVSHMARANPQWQHFKNGQEVLIIFTGPHAYISPAWYASAPAVPTWNYTAVHAYGVPRLITDHERFASRLQELIEFYEASRAGRWDGVMPPEFRDRLMKGIVGVEVEITRLEGKFKLSQNRPLDAPGVITALSASEDPMDREVASLMQQICVSK